MISINQMDTNSQKQKASKPEIILVLGMHRTGTSAITNLISSLDYDAGDNLMPADSDNKKGYWEDLDIYNLNNEILSFLFLTWEKREALNYRKINILGDIVWEKFSNRAKSIVNKKLNLSDKIIIKDPRFSILLPFWKIIFKQLHVNTKYVISLRNPFDVAQSLKKRNGFPIEKSIQLWSYYYNCCITDIPNSSLVLNFEELSNDDEGIKKKIIKFIGGDSDQKGNLNTEKIIDHSLIHHQSSRKDFTEFTSQFPIVVKAYNEIKKVELIKAPDSSQFIIKQDQPSIIKKGTNHTSSLFYSFESTEHPEKAKFSQCNHTDGEVNLTFNIESQSFLDHFNLFLCDKPCFVKIDSIKIITNEADFKVTKLHSNAIYHHNNSFIFGTNTPEIKFSLPKPLDIIKVELKGEVFTSSIALASFIIPVLQYSIDLQKTKKSAIQQEVKQKQEQIKLVTEQNESFQLKINRLNTEVTETTIKNIQLTEKSNYLNDKIESEIEFRNKLEVQYELLAKLLKTEQQKSADKEVQFLKANNKVNKLIQKIHAIKSENDNLYQINQTLLIHNDEILKKEAENKILRNQLKTQLEDQSKIEEDFASEQKKSEYLYSLKLENETEIIRLKIEEERLLKEISHIKKSASWIITWPFRVIASVLISPFIFAKKLKDDFVFGIELLKREGIKTFFFRLWWYMRGKRLNEDIYLKKNKKNTTLKIKESGDTTIPFKLPTFKNPLVSIIIPVYNQWNYTYNCIKSILENTTDVTYEVIVGDDVSTDETKNISKIIENVKVIHNKKNLKFVLNNNNAAKYAKGQYLIFLNNDTVVHANWLKPIVKLFENDEKVGIVGSKLVYPDGRLQEAGGIIWNDASGWNFGRLDDPEKPEYNYVRETDYVSGASLMITRKLWDELNGFDEHFAPAYYEDTDIAFRAREAGFLVKYQPLSVITHFEGISNGKVLTEGLKKYQVNNAIKFNERWSERLQKEQYPNAKNVFLAKDRSRDKKQVLVIDHYVPHFDKDAGSRSTYSYLCLLLKMGFKVTFIGDNYFKHEPYTSILQQKGVEVIYGNYYARNNQNWLKENSHYFHFVFLHRMHIAPKYVDIIRKHSKAKLFYIGHDLQFVSSKRKFEITNDKLFLEESQKFKTIETILFNTVDVICPFSTYEAPFIEKLVPQKEVQTLPVFFYEQVPERKTNFEQRKDILFVGGFGHPPNVDAIIWFVYEILPHIKKQLTDVKLYVVGSKPTEEVLALSNDDIVITGFVSDEELENYYQQCRVAVLPLRVGAGVKGKLLEACYYQIPTVITTVASEGIPAIENHCYIEDDATKFAKKTIELYKNHLLWEEQSKLGKQLIENNYTEKATRKIFENILK